MTRVMTHLARALLPLSSIFLLAAHADAQSAQSAPHAMIASNSSVASQAGIDILKRGGNAVDAAVATGFALAVVLPEAGNLGGGGYMVIRMADGRAAALDFRETAPRRATRDMYVDASGKLTGESLIGYKAAGVPGSVAGLCEAHRRFGKLPLATVIAPAIRLAERGFVVDSFASGAIGRNAKLIGDFAGKDVFLRDGRAPAVGDTLRQPALARTLRAIASRGASAFYRGAIARELARDVLEHGGLIDTADLAAYKPLWQKPIVTAYRGYTVLGMPLSSSGGLTMANVLQSLSASPELPPRGSVRYAQIMANAMREAFVYRNTQLGDTTTVGREGTETTHYSVVDANGNAVATTTTINSLFGAGAFVASLGFLLNNEMDDFAAQPGKPNQFGLVMGESNAIAPGKRPLSSMSPTIVVDASKKVVMVAGSRGGPRIITSTFEVISNVLDYHLSLAEAMSAPRMHHQALPDTLFFERGALRSAVVDSLKAMGISAAPTSSIGLVDAILRTRTGLEGMDDPRRQQSAVGY